MEEKGKKRKRDAVEDGSVAAGANGDGGLGGEKKPTDLKLPSKQPPKSTDKDKEYKDKEYKDKEYKDKEFFFKDLYAGEVNFRELAKRHSPFRSVLKSTGQLDFTDPAAVMKLTKTLLWLDFKLKIQLPDDRLCPPVPNRHNYILWLKHLLDSSSYDEPGGKLTGLDIGTGSSCIYPLLGCAQRPWSFIGTDLDERSLSYAAENVKRNGLEDRIRLVHRKRATDPLIPLAELGIESVDFAMTNPPFYASEDEMQELAAKKQRPPASACTGAPVEMVCEGGEVAFVGRMLTESLVLRERVGWYTAMLGKMTSLEALVARLREEGIDNYAVTEFVQGTRTKRWAVAWSFGAMRPSSSAARGVEQTPWRKILPSPVHVELGHCPVDQSGFVAARLNTLLQSLQLSYRRQPMFLPYLFRGFVGTGENVWGRAWRRRNLQRKTGPGQEDGERPSPSSGRPNGQEETVQATDFEEKNKEKPMSGFMVCIKTGEKSATVSCCWREGHDTAIFQSFCGFLKRELALPD